jgi:MoaA/NifB/PqqE/SkfB family radical SAM enzyme
MSIPKEIAVEPATIQADSADVYINTTCNFGCETCFLGEEYFSQNLTMSRQEVAAIGRWLVSAGVLDVAILGGEPTLHHDLIGVAAELRKTGVDCIRLITNGTPRARRLLDGPLDGLVDLTYVSLDGASSESNDALRGRGTFRHAMLAIELLQQRKMPFVITSTLGQAAVEELDALLELAEDSGCKTLNLHWLSSVGRARHRNLAVAPARWQQVVSQIASYSPRRPGFTVECQVGSLTPTANWSADIDPMACAVRGRSNLQFMPDGRVFSCGLIVDTPALAAYRWDGQSLLERTPTTELSICEGFSTAGCPVRQTVLKEPKDPEHLPVCIYERVTRHRSADGRLA